MSITASLNGNIQLSDSASGTIAMKKAFAALSMTGTEFTEGQSVSLASGPNVIGLPVSPILFLYVKNLHATNTVAVTWTPNGGASASILTLQPGASIIFMEITPASGITALTLTASASATPVEYIVAG
jgi:hypothetical protein